MVELGHDGDLNFFKPRVEPVGHFSPSPLCSISRQEDMKTDSTDDSDDPGSDRVGLAVMQELLGGLPRLPRGGPRVPPLSLRIILELSFLSGNEDDEASDLGNDDDKVPIGAFE
ncbi:hypothetical protein HAX54_049368 [Datura stramonium]|uniref:Uncharacterized protein n=1 Tax=Datura stramonium TaxID=4076 RepID=A0ABS8WKF7_DATST|nr:hypothetical protein [Datura stramonium]